MSKFLFCLLVFIPQISISQPFVNDHEEEQVSDYYKNSWRQGIVPKVEKSSGLSVYKKNSLLIKAMIEMVNDDFENSDVLENTIIKSLISIHNHELSYKQKLKVLSLKLMLNLDYSVIELERLDALVKRQIENEEVESLCLYRNTINKILGEKIIDSRLCFTEIENLKASIFKDLFNHPTKTTALYMFCRKQREYPCLLLMRDKQGQVVNNEDGTLWQQKALGYSRKKKKYWQIDGHTPSGVYLMRGVMPKANKKLAYGKYRRVILNFVGSSKNEVQQKNYLPRSSHNLQWWQEARIARDNGRSAFRIHGAGFTTTGRSKPYYPFMATRGCVAQIEGNFRGKEYVDQRDLLDQLMKVQNLNVTYKNETRIRGVLYVIDIDDSLQPVELHHVKPLLDL